MRRDCHLSGMIQDSPKALWHGGLQRLPVIHTVGLECRRWLRGWTNNRAECPVVISVMV